MAAFLGDENTDNVCFACHVSPDGDTVASAVALARLLRARGRRAFVYLPEEAPASLGFLFEDFDNTPFLPETVVAVDVSAPHRLGEDFPYHSLVRAVIDHHTKNSFEGVLSYVEEDAAATGMLVAKLYDELGVEPDEKVAEALYTALSTDTGRFCHSNTTADVFSLASRLVALSKNGNFTELNRVLFVEKDAALLRLEGYINTHAKLFSDAGLVFFVLTQKMRRRFGLTDKSDLGSLVDVLRAFSGFDVCILAKEQQERGVYKLSVRTNKTVSASDFCARFGGGGHVRAAGATVRARSVRVLEKRLLAALTEERGR